MASFYYYDHSGKTTHQKEKQPATAINLLIIAISKLSNLIGYQLPWFQL